MTTQEDVEALRRARVDRASAPAMSPEDFARFLATSSEGVSAEALRRRRGPRGPEPFKL